jgi:ribonuclease J
LARGPLPLWGPRHALELARRRLAEAAPEIDSSAWQEVRPGQQVAAGSFKVEPIRVSHSIVEATALCIESEAGRVVHSGDFKFDPAPPDGEPTNEARLAELGDAGVELLLSDSTNVDTEGSSGSEADVARALDELVRDAKRRVFVALFASNVQRLISIGQIARKRGRRICLLGRSLATHVEVARTLGYLDWPESMLLPPERARTYPKDEILILATGTQGEPAAAMSRLAQGSHRTIDVDPGDTVIFSSRVIPGCDRPVAELVGQLWRRGALVETHRTSKVHTSGHANRDDQRHLIKLLRPKNFIPVHGTRHHLQRHAELALSAGAGSALVIENGQTAVLDRGQLRRGADVPAGYVNVACGGTVLDGECLARRRDLGRCGVLSVGLLRDRRGELCGPPRLQALGLASLERPLALRELEDLLVQNWHVLQRDSERPPQSAASRPSSQRFNGLAPRFVGVQQQALEIQVERCVQRWADERFGLRPLVLVHLLDNRS